MNVYKVSYKVMYPLGIFYYAFYIYLSENRIFAIHYFNTRLDLHIEKV